MNKITKILGFTSVLLLALCVFLSIKTANFKSHGLVTDGVVVEMIRKRGDNSDTYSPVVDYQVNGEKFTHISNTSSNPPAFSVGENVKMIYDPANPGAAKIDGFFSLWFGTIFTAIFAIIFAIPAIMMFIINSRRRELENYFQTHGQTMNLKISKIAQDTTLKVNGRSPYRIYAEWLDSSKNELHIFKSSHIWYDPTPYVKGENINVKVDTSNPKKYLMDTSFLPKKV